MLRIVLPLCLFFAGALAAADTLPPADSLALGARLYAGNCAACHGHKGKGDGQAAYIFRVRPTDLTDPDMTALGDDDLTIVIVRGKKEMPKYGKMLKEGEVKAVVEFIRTLAPKEKK